MDGISRGRGLVSLFLFALLATTFSSTTTSLPAQQQEYVVEIGDVTVLPGTSLVEIPVYVTNEEPLTFWQMGLDYDNLLLNITAVTTQGTVSEPLAPQITSTTVGSLIYGLEVDYSNGTEFPAGSRQLALYLLVSIVNPTQTPTGTNLTETITVGSENLPVQATTNAGVTLAPTAVSGTVDLLAAPVLRIQRASGTPFDSTVAVPVELWTAGPSTVLEMGLDYDNLLLNEVSFEGTELQPYQGSMIVNLNKLPNGGTSLRIEAPPGRTFPQFSADVVAELVFSVGPPALNFTELTAGEFTITADPLTSRVDGVPFFNVFENTLEIDPVFVRGDPNFSGSVDLADVPVVLSVLFLNFPVPCLEAVDVDDNGEISVADAIMLTGELFSSSSPPIPFPYPSPGPDEDPNDGVSCF